MIQQVLREWPPGYGGVERVAHELAIVWGGQIWSLDVKGISHTEVDSSAVTYSRVCLPCMPSFFRLRFPLPSLSLWRLLNDGTPLHGHLPSPEVLLILLLARLFRPRRRVTVHWHSFLQPSRSLIGILYAIYEWLAVRSLCLVSDIITTSPVLVEELKSLGCHPDRLFLLPCCLSSQQELQALQLPFRDPSSHSPFRVLFIGRLDSYKRVDWLLQALSCLHLPWELVIVGDGPRRSYFHQLSLQLFGSDSNHLVCFKGRLSEKNKLDQLAIADILVLPSDKSNEAFGIVQLEAMAAGIPSLAFQCPRSGMAWVAQLPDLDWSQTPNGLVDVLYRLASDRPLCSHLGLQARSRYLELFSRDIWLRQLTFWY